MSKPENDSLFEAPPMGEQERMVEAILFASADPVSVQDLIGRMPHGCDPAEAIAHLRKRYEGRGVNLVKIDSAWAIRTAPDLGFLMQKTIINFIQVIVTTQKQVMVLALHLAIVLQINFHYAIV